VGRIPFKRLAVDGETVTVEERDDRGRMASGHPIGGEYTRNKIVIDRYMPTESKQVAVLHEALHHCWERGGVGRYLSGKTEELVLSLLDSWLWQILRENPELARWIAGEEG